MPSPNDQAVLNCILSPLLPSLGVGDDDGKKQPCDLSDSSLPSETLSRVKELEKQGVIAAECGELEASIALFSQAISLAPERASGFNNRAQALRLMGRNQEALDDLDQAVSLSDGKGMAGVNALCQRALLRLLKGDEPGAMDDVKTASLQGNDFARSMLVRLNPYSALCNQMLREMMAKLTEMKDKEEK